MKLNNTIKFIILALIIITCLCILYFCYYPTYIVEGIENCENCEVKPTLGNCIQIKDISHNVYEDIIGNIDFDIIDTSYVFCPWKPRCNNVNNIISQSKRLELSNDNIDNGLKDDVNCCPNSVFYNKYTVNLNTIPQLQNTKTICDKINDTNDQINIRNRVGKDYFKLRHECNQLDSSGLYFNKTIRFSGNPIADPKLTIPEIIEILSTLKPILDSEKIPESARSKDDLNNELNILKNKDTLTEEDQAKLYQIQIDLSHNYASDISYVFYKHRLLEYNETNKETINSDFILQEDQFYDCTGIIQDVKNIENKKFTDTDIYKLNNEDFFDVDSGAEYTTMQDNNLRLYPSREDLEMEVKNLPSIQKSNDVNMNVIKTYLQSINSIYQKQFDALIAPRTHAVPQTLQFDNDSLSIKPSTFFVYDNTYTNNDYQCEPGVTGDDNFKYCGPAPNYTEFKP